MANSHAICAKTGLELTVTHFPYSFNKGQISHPIFSLVPSENIGCDICPLLKLYGKCVTVSSNPVLAHIA